MSKFFILLFITSTSVLVLFQNCSVSKFQSNELRSTQAGGPNVSPSGVYTQVLVEKNVVVGMSPSGPYTTSIKIFSDGSVYSYENNSASLIATLSSTVINSFISAFSQMTASTLTDFSVNNPYCADSAEITYFAYKQSSSQIPLARSSQCHEYYSSDWQSYQVKSFMDGFDSLVIPLANITTAINTSNTNVLMKVNSHGAYGPNPAGGGTRILYNGTIQKFNNGTGVVTNLGTLAPLVLRSYLSWFSNSMVSVLSDTNPGGPICVDAGDVDYTAYTSSNVQISLGRESSCHTFRSNNESARAAVTVLEGLNYLSNF